ncbi:MAG: TetR/AcrR family transcriptional regulator [Actinomycetota bacterium]
MTGTESEPTRTRGFKKKERTRRLLISAAIEEIASNGEAFTILDVTKRADVSNGTFYNYFDDRTMLVDAVITEVLSAFTDTSAELVTLDDPVRRFATITALLLEHAAANPQMATVMLRLQSTTSTDTRRADPFRHLRHDLNEAAELGRLNREPTDAAVDLVAGALSRAVSRIATVGATDDYRADMIRLLLEGFGLDGPEAEALATEAVAAAPELSRAYLRAEAP